MRELTLAEIRAITFGAERVCQDESGVRFYRFTEEEEDFYRFRLPEFYKKSFSTAGIKLRFRTDSRTLSLAVNARQNGSTRHFFSLDVLAGGTPVGYIDNFSHTALPADYWCTPYPLGDYEADFDLGEGEKTVTVHLPWSAVLTLRKIALDDGATVAPVCPEKRFIAYGDSITHGYDATRPHLRQMAKLADALGAAEHNKAIGGEVFCPGLAECPSAFTPDFITVAYGTNDWAKTDYETFAANCPAFYEALAARHPHTPIFAITPIPRGGAMLNETFGHFSRSAEKIREVAARHENITVIEGEELMPYDVSLYSDGYLHPNDAGFAVYAENLIRKIREHIG